MYYFLLEFAPGESAQVVFSSGLGGASVVTDAYRVVFDGPVGPEYFTARLPRKINS
jgi:hypothetical protein